MWRLGSSAALLTAAVVLTVGTGTAAIVGLATGTGGHGCHGDLVYHGRYVHMQGIPMSKAYQSTLNITRDHC